MGIHGCRRCIYYRKIYDSVVDLLLKLAQFWSFGHVSKSLVAKSTTAMNPNRLPIPSGVILSVRNCNKNVIGSLTCPTNSSFDIPPDFEGVCTRRQHDGTRLYNSYYQWIPIFLAIQAGMFYIPRCVWLICEGGLMAYIVKGKNSKIRLRAVSIPISKRITIPIP